MTVAATASQHTASLPARWTPLKPHPEQARLWQSSARFRVVPAGRRSGKTELAKRELVRKALTCTQLNGRYVAAAPTFTQAREIFWIDLQSLIPKGFIVGEPKLTPVPTIQLINGARIQVLGMDRPARIEGSPVDGVILDEYGNMRREAWDQHVRPALSTIGRPGWAWLIGVPEGRNHYYERFSACSVLDDWEAFHWRSESVLPPEEIEAAKRELDELTYEQEYGGSFVNFEGRAYHAFDTELHVSDRLDYDPSKPLDICLDFNVRPGVAVLSQELELPKWVADMAGVPWRPNETMTFAFAEVHIPKSSTTQRVMSKVIEMMKDKHHGVVNLYGDASGGAQGSAKVAGSDWDIVRQMLSSLTNWTVKDRVPKSNPPQRVRLGAANARLRSALGEIRAAVHPRCKHLIRDLEGVRANDDGSIAKEVDSLLTHMSDAWTYKIVRNHRLSSHELVMGQW